MRTTKIDMQFDSDVVLTTFSNSRIKIDQTGTNRYRMTSELKVWRHETHEFIYRYLVRKKPKMTIIYGNCGCPSGYFWGPLNPSSQHEG